VAASVAIVLNALLLQSRPHPAPYFSTREAEAGVADPDELVREIQDALKRIGYYSGPLDGMLGPQTRSSIMAFEQRAGREPLGNASAELLNEIESNRMNLRPATLREALSTAPASPSAKPDPLISAVQRALALAAYGPVGVDGFLGPQTRDAALDEE
jgi:peptidoglycan hydrolase-like protein with peptidoglycan-binding domain